MPLSVGGVRRCEAFKPRRGAAVHCSVVRPVLSANVGKVRRRRVIVRVARQTAVAKERHKMWVKRQEAFTEGRRQVHAGGDARKVRQPVWRKDRPA